MGGGSLDDAPAAAALAVVGPSSSEEEEDGVGDGDGEERMLLAGADFRRGGGRVLVLAFLEVVVDDVAVGRGGLKAGGLRFGIVRLGSGAIPIVGGWVKKGDDGGCPQLTVGSTHLKVEWCRCPAD